MFDGESQQTALTITKVMGRWTDAIKFFRGVFSRKQQFPICARSKISVKIELMWHTRLILFQGAKSYGFISSDFSLHFLNSLVESLD
jgi:hypothetical protein